MTAQKIRGRKKGETLPNSRRSIMDALKPGQSCLFLAEPGQPASKLQACIASNYRGGESMRQKGLTQKGGLLVFPDELPVACVRVTRDPKSTAEGATV